MEITIQKAVLHILDTQVTAPVLSDLLIEQEEALIYLGSLAAKAWKSEEARGCELIEDSFFRQTDASRLERDFVAQTGELAQKWFDVMQVQPAIPAGDVAFLWLTIDGVEYFAAMKLNYKAGWVHYFEMHEEGTASNRIVRQETMLPAGTAKPDEAFFVAVQPLCSTVRILEKKYEIDGRKQAYLAHSVVGARPGMSPKEKLAAICEAAQEVNQQFYGSLGVEEPEVAAAVCEEYRSYRSQATQSLEEPEPAVPVAQLCEKLYGDLPHAKEAFEKELAQREIEMDEPMPMPSTGVRKLQKQSLRSSGGVEIKVPVSIYRDENEIQFIKNSDGTTSLLIKNILL